MEKTKLMLLVTGIACSCLAIIALSISYYYSANTAQLFKLSIPALILLLLVVQLKQKTNGGTK